MAESAGTSASGARPSTHSSTGNGSRPREQEGHFVIAECQRNTDPTIHSSNQETSEESECEELQILEEIVDIPPEHQMFLNLFRQVDPVQILLDGKTQSTFTDVVKKTVFTTDTDQDGKCKLNFISSKEYNYEACKRRILSLSLPNEPPDCSEDERTLFLQTALDFSQTQSVHALGALLRYLDLNWSNLSMELHTKPQFMSLTRISLADIVTMDEDTYCGLQIFNSIPHPSNFKKGIRGSNKEGHSIFRLFSKCSSTVGHKKLRVMLRHPTTDIATLKRRQDVVEFFMRSQSDTIMRNICCSLRFIKNVNGILAKIKALSSKPYQWKSLYNTLYNAVLICELCESASKASKFLEQLASRDNSKLYEMALYMNRIIDFDLTKSEGKFTVKAGVDPDLDMKKQTLAGLAGLMSATAQSELARLPPAVQECSMLYMPHLGYVLAVRAPADPRATHEHLPDMKFMFQNNDYIHYKSKGCEELDVLIGDTYPEIMAHETRIMMRLTEVVLEGLAPLATLIDQCAELDCLIAIAKVCKEYNYVRPELTLEKRISITQGKHPLCLAASDQFVPNDAESGPDGCVTVLTGPNASGKSVYMKQIGLIVYLAHIGSFVPAEAATIGVVSNVYSRIHSTESIAAHMSAFLIDLRQMSLALRTAPARSLVLVDEFGKGTAAGDGLALLAAALNALLFRQAACPHVLLATHYLALHRYIVDTPLVTYLCFEHVMEGGAPVFVYRARRGRGAASFALAVAAAAGVPPAALARARRLLPAVLNNELPPENRKIVLKLKNSTDSMKNSILTEEI